MAQTLPRDAKPGDRLRMSYEEFLAWVGDDGRAEWVDGEVIVLDMPNTLHQELLEFLSGLLSLYVRLLRLGKVYFAPYQMRLPEVLSLREPDLLFVATANLVRIVPERLVGPADLVVEILSPDSVTRDRRDKLAEYERAGVPEYWIFDILKGRRAVQAYARDDRGVYRPIALDGQGRIRSVVLPGFWFDPAWIATDPLPDPLELVEAIAPDALAAAVERARTRRLGTDR